MLLKDFLDAVSLPRESAMKLDAKVMTTFNCDLSEWGTARLVMSAAVGISFILFTLNSTEIKGLSPQPIRGLNCEEQVIRQADPCCVVCGQNKSASEFASKGKGRPSRLCRDCDNDRRRNTYKPRTTRSSRSEWWVSFESGEVLTKEQWGHEVLMILGLLTEHRLIVAADLNFNDSPTVDQLIRRKSVIDEIT